MEAAVVRAEASAWRNQRIRVSPQDPFHEIVDVACSPRFSPVYASFYYLGLEKVMRRKVRVSSEVAPFPHRANALAFEIRTARGRTLRLFADAQDQASLDEDALDWCDVYGKVNLDPTCLPPSQSRKVEPLGPNFGLRLWRPEVTIVRYAATTRYLPLSATAWRSHWGGYKWQMRRLPETRYVPGVSEDNYLFFAAWPWKKHQTVNPPRARFIAAARSLGDLDFEGGFAPRRRRDLPEVLALSASRRYPLGAYLERLGRSVCAFNSPAVHDCLGWKLGEFLALGKAVISLCLTRSLPAPLEHGEHLHFIADDESAMRQAIQLLRDDREYRRHLETNARRYYEEYLAPAAVVGRMLERSLRG